METGVGLGVEPNFPPSEVCALPLSAACLF